MSHIAGQMLSRGEDGFLVPILPTLIDCITSCIIGILLLKGRGRLFRAYPPYLMDCYDL